MSECAELRAAITRLEAKIDAQGKVDVSQIINQVKAALPGDPRFMGVMIAGVLGGGGMDQIRKQLERIASRTNNLDADLKEQKNVIEANKRRAANAEQRAERAMNEAKRNASRANQAVATADKAAETAKNTKNSLQRAIDILNRDVADLFGKYGQFANSLASILGIVGSLAGLASLYATLKVVFPRLDAHDRELDVQRQALSDNLSAAHRGIAIAREADRKASAAIREANTATDKADRATGRANSAIDKADQATGKANSATDKADRATGRANSAIDKADRAIGEANIATRKANKAQGGVDSINSDLLQNYKPGIVYSILLAQGLAKDVDEFLNELVLTQATVDGIVSYRIPNVQQSADKAAHDASTASKTASEAIQKANAASGRADQAIREANGISARASEAITRANAANGKADQAVGVAGGATSIATTALTTAQTALSQSRTVYQPQVINSQVTPNTIVTALNLAEAKAAIREQVAKDFKLDPNAVKPLTLAEAKAEINRTIKQDFKFDPTVVQPVTIPEARQLIRETIERDFKLTPGTVTASPTPAQIEQVLPQTTTVKNLQAEVQTVKATQATEAKVNEQAVAKLDTVNAKLDQLTARPAPPTEVKLDAQTVKKIDTINGNTSKTIDIVGTIEDIVKRIPTALNTIIGGVNQSIRQLNLSLDQINQLIKKLNAFIVSVNQQLRSILNYVIAILAIATLIQPVILATAARVGLILVRLGKLVNWLVVDRVLNVFIFITSLHNALMLSNNLKETLLTMLSSVGNATGLLENAEGENVDLNVVFNRSIEQLMILFLGEENYAGLKVTWRKYNRIYQATANLKDAMANMFNSLGDAVETVAEHTGKIGNALRSAGGVAEGAYQWFSEKVNAKMSKFLQYSVTVGGVIAVSSAINEIAESVIEGQQAKKELDETTDKFKKELVNAPKIISPDNKAVAEEVAKQKENSLKDPTDELEKGLFSFITNTGTVSP